MYIKFYNALGRVDPLAGRGQSPVPKLGHGQGRHLTLPLYSHTLTRAHTQSSTLIRTNAHLQLFWCAWPLFHLVMVTYKATPASNLSVTLSPPKKSYLCQALYFSFARSTSTSSVLGCRC